MATSSTVKTDPGVPYPVVGQTCQIYDPKNGDRPLAGIVTNVDPGDDPDNPQVQLTAFLPGGLLTWYKASGHDLSEGGTWGNLPPA